MICLAVKKVKDMKDKENYKDDIKIMSYSDWLMGCVIVKIKELIEVGLER